MSAGRKEGVGERRKAERKGGREGQLQPHTGCCFKKQSLASVRTLTKWGSVLSEVCSAPGHLIVWPWLWWNLFLKEMGKHKPWCFNSKVSCEVINDPEVGFGSRTGYFLGSPQRGHKRLRSLEREKGVWEEDGMTRKDRKTSVSWSWKGKEILLNPLPITAKLLPVWNNTLRTGWPAALWSLRKFINKNL